MLNGFGAQPPSCSVGTRGCFVRGRTARRPFTPGWCKAYNESSYTCILSYAYMAYTRKTLLYYIHMAGRMNYVKLRGKRPYLVNIIVIKSMEVTSLTFVSQVTGHTWNEV